MQALALSHFPAINATLNGTAAILLVTAKRLIDRRQRSLAFVVARYVV